MDRRRCLICSNFFQETITLKNCFSTPELICEKCCAHFTLADEKRCQHCMKKLKQDEHQCMDCEFIQNMFTPVDRIQCLYDYNEFVRSVIHQYKFHKDVALAELFARQLRHFDTSKFESVIPMPTSEERLKSRGFDSIGEIVARSKVKRCDCLKTHNRKKQAELTKKERLKEKNPFYLEEIPPKKILLVDDIYTTGMTVHRAAEVLREHSEYIEVLTFARA